MGQSIASTAVTCFVAFVAIVGFTAAPVAAAGGGVSLDGDGVSIDLEADDDSVSIGGGQDGVSVDDDVSVEDEEPPTPEGDLDTDPTSSVPDGPTNENDGSGGPFPEAVCTDVLDQVNQNVPYDQIPWVTDLPPEMQPPGLPWTVVTPRAVAGIAFALVPNQCEVADPNDPPYDPRSSDDNVDPDANLDVARAGPYQDGGVALIQYDVTLDQSSEKGPGVSGKVGGLTTSEFGDVDIELAVNDGEKTLVGAAPRIRYSDGGATGFGKIDVGLVGKELGVQATCDGQECQPKLRGLPNLVALPAIPAPTDQDAGSSQGEGPFPEAVCTDLLDQVNQNVPYDQIPWVTDLPPELQPPGLPWTVVTPRAVAGIAFALVPNQCEIVDPNNPPYDPRTSDDNVDPNADVRVSRAGPHEGGGVALIQYDVTLDQSSENGPGVAGKVGILATPEFGDVDIELAVNDGEKMLVGAAPRVRYSGSGSTAHVKADVGLVGKQLGVQVDCDGQECQPAPRGLPDLVPIPAIPAPTGG